jgi:hypothetical protein
MGLCPVLMPAAGDPMAAMPPAPGGSAKGSDFGLALHPTQIAPATLRIVTIEMVRCFVTGSS